MVVNYGVVRDAGCIVAGRLHHVHAVQHKVIGNRGAASRLIGIVRISQRQNYELPRSVRVEDRVYEIIGDR